MSQVYGLCRKMLLCVTVEIEHITAPVSRKVRRLHCGCTGSRILLSSRIRMLTCRIWPDRDPNWILVTWIRPDPDPSGSGSKPRSLPTAGETLLFLHHNWKKLEWLFNQSINQSFLLNVTNAHRAVCYPILWPNFYLSDNLVSDINCIELKWLSYWVFVYSSVLSCVISWNERMLWCFMS